ncbi:SCO family protein [candidate division KSB1 bacterium]|nr:SCO family protein [candidate division KSB1 bacterium]
MLKLSSITLLLFLAGCQSSEPSFRGTELGDSIPTTDFTLTDQYNQTFTLGEHKGKVVLLFFGFTYCPDVCPLTLSTWKKVQEAIKEDADKVDFVYITVDPERDTQEKIAKHLAVFSPDFIGLTGEVEDLQEVYSSYGVYREKNQISDSAAGYLINHTSRINIIDPKGIWRLTFSHDAPVEDLVHDIRLLLKNQK